MLRSRCRAAERVTFVFVQDFKIVDRPYDEVAFHFVGGIDQVLEAGIGPARAEGERLRVKVAPRGWPTALGKTVEIHPGHVRDLGDAMIVPFSWQVVRTTALFPRFDGDLEIAPFGPSQVMIALHGSYESPGGAWGTRADEMVLHRLAESTVRAFLEGLCASVGRAAVG